MKAARVVEFRKPLQVMEVPDPVPGPQDAIIRVEANGICRSDWHAWQGDWAWIGLRPQLPFTPQCLAEYDLDGWTVPDLINPDDVNQIWKRGARGA